MRIDGEMRFEGNTLAMSALGQKRTSKYVPPDVRFIPPKAKVPLIAQWSISSTESALHHPRHRATIDGR
jgi:hypothetical protein